MKKLCYVVLAVTMIAFGSGWMVMNEATEFAKSPPHFDSACLNGVDPINPSSLTTTDLAILTAACRVSQNSQAPGSNDPDSLTFTDRAILNWVRQMETIVIDNQTNK